MKRNPRLTATWVPRHRAELTSEGEEWIGWRGEWEVTHLLDEGDEDTPTGTPMCTISVDQAAPYPPTNAFIWVAILDLHSIEWDEETLEDAAQATEAVIKRRRFVRSQPG